MKKILLTPLLALLLAMPLPASLGVSMVVHAQQKTKQTQQQVKRRPNLFEMLFGGALRRQTAREDQPKARRVIVSPNSGSRVTSIGPAQKTVAVKSETASKILVVGDFIADGLGWGLEQVYAANPNAAVVDRSSGLAGIVRNDIVDWPAELAAAIDEHKPVIVVMQIGMNDRQQMKLAEGRVAKLSDPWRKEYEQRIEAIVKAVRERKLPLVWLGLPPVKSPAMNADYLVFNEVFRTKTEAGGGVYVDVWDGFTNSEGQFVNAGPDINGQIVRLRNSDGINMTKAGMSKLAFYAEKEIRKAVGLGTESIVASLSSLQGPSVIAAPEYDPASTGRTVVISLDGPMADGFDLLEGAVGFLDDAAADKSMSRRLVTKGLGLMPRSGRVDAAWGPPGESVTPATATTKPAQTQTNATAKTTVQ